MPGRRARYPAGCRSCSPHTHCRHTPTLLPECSTSPAQCTCLETGPGRCILWWGLPCVHHSPLCIIDTGHHHHSARQSHGLEVPAACPPGSVPGPGPGRGIGRASGQIPGQPHALAHQRPCLPDCWGRAELRPAAPARRDGPSCSWRLLAQQGTKQHKPWDSPNSGIMPTAVLQECPLPTSWRQADISDWRAPGKVSTPDVRSCCGEKREGGKGRQEPEATACWPQEEPPRVQARREQGLTSVWKGSPATRGKPPRAWPWKLGEQSG